MSRVRSATNRRKDAGRRRWTTFVLIMLALRALVPAGFMLAPVDGQPAIVLCDTDAPGARHHVGHHHAGHAHADPTCPYAQSAAPAPLPALPALTAAPGAAADALPTLSAQVHARFGPSRQQSPRAPPLFA
jgi:hypothetical protein